MRLAVLALAAVTGCAPLPPKRPLSEFVGAPVDALVSAYGEPAAQEPLGDGGTRYRWRYRGSKLVARPPEPPTVAISRSGAPVVVPGQTPTPDVAPAACDLSVEVDAAARVRNWRAVGDACLQVVERPALWRSAP